MSIFPTKSIGNRARLSRHSPRCRVAPDNWERKSHARRDRVSGRGLHAEPVSNPRLLLAVLSPVLMAEIGASTGDLARASGLWFAGFALMQLPVGWALDHLGPRRTASVLFGIGGAGGGGGLRAGAGGGAGRDHGGNGSDRDRLRADPDGDLFHSSRGSTRRPSSARWPV